MGLSIAIEEPTPADDCAPITGSAAMPPEVCPPEERFPMTAEDLASPGSGSWGRVSAAGLSDVWLLGATAMAIKRLYVEERARSGRRPRPGPRGRLETGPELAAAMRLSRGFGHTNCGGFGGSVDIAPTIVMERCLPLQDPAQVSLA
ncbi:hypothetical protein CCR90_15810 [Rhodovulum sulfidophilum]|uniref:hypothetical protein n=1 Tax=Rhodovulum sulfidophilum TaxID=35806 RepID=UPI001912963D|nr:hypothetical protein [Rhodovulum sulfidophilum]MBK5925202.1 hypothetical protein [Rhodovulum sulfidophilum]